MERLTKRLESGTVVMDCDACKAKNAICTMKSCRNRLKDRLAAYEDTGLEPDAVNAIKHSLMGKSIAEIKEFEGIPIQRLRELAQAEQDGRLVVLPCKVGDMVYVIGESCDFCETYLDEPERCMRCEKGHYVEERGFELWMLSELNESIFLTREEAEAALAGKGGDA